MDNKTIYIKQYLVNYKDQETFKRLKSFGLVTYFSKVLNVLFIDTHKGIKALRNVEGVTFVKESNKRLIDNKH